ncbi:MAG: GMC family oxidoreductase [Rhodospirillales bacterium]|nr:GMC family oxidoreductase [Rhodospirillales bacterium]
MYIPYVANTGWHALIQRLSSLTPTIAKPLSRGRITLINTVSGLQLLIEFNYHSDDRDRVRHMNAVCRAVGMLLSPEVRPLWHTAISIFRSDRAGQFNNLSTTNAIRTGAVATLLDFISAANWPILGMLTKPSVDILKLAQDEDALMEFVQVSFSGPGRHAGTCRMGATDDPDVVVDPEGLVYGVDALRVVDASIMPWVPRGNTNILTLILAKKITAAIGRDFVSRFAHNISRGSCRLTNRAVSIG